MFPNEDNNLHNVVLPEEKVTKNTKTLSNFSIDDIKMVQCNGARRSLNLKLSSPHNLRARAKHESGHLLRSKGSPWHEVDKSEKFYDKLEGYTIKKRSKGTIWIEEEDHADDKYAEELLKESKQEDYKIKSFSKDLDEVVYHAGNKEDTIDSKQSDPEPPADLQSAVVHAQNCIINSRHIPEDYLKSKDNKHNGDENSGPFECAIHENDVVEDNFIVNVPTKLRSDEHLHSCALQGTVDARKFPEDSARIDATDIVCNGHSDKVDQQQTVVKAFPGENARCAKPKHHPRTNRRGGRNIRGRHRLSVEERLIEDNRAYYKVEVLGNKLRSSAAPGGNSQHAASKDGGGDDEEKKEEAPSSEKPVVVRFKRVRKSELSLLSDEAESFMFGEPKRDDSSDVSYGDQSSVLPRDTESSEVNETSVSPSSPLISSSPVKQEMIEEDSQDSVHLGRARKRRRTQAEAFIKDNADYYKFETPGSRLRYQAPLTGIKDTVDGGGERAKKSADGGNGAQAYCDDDDIEKIYPSKPSAEIEKMQFSFEAIPQSEPWYQTYQRQDTGAEYWHCFSENDSMKPFLLPYEIENFSETMLRNLSSRIEGKKRGRGRGIGCVGRSPRKSPRCHASTLAIMSTIIRKREQQQHPASSALYTIEESPVARSRTHTPRPLEQKQDARSKTSEVDEELKEMARTIDEMLSAKGITELEVSFEPDEQMQTDLYESSVPKGAPTNLLELLDNCHDVINCLENSSCASSECGEGNLECPLKRRKRRKNRTGWPDNKMKRKLQSNNSKILVAAADTAYCERKTLVDKRLFSDNSSSTERRALLMSNGSSGETEPRAVSGVVRVVERFNPKSDADVPLLESVCAASHKSCHEAPASKGDKSVETDPPVISTDSYTELSENAMCNDLATDVRKGYPSSKEYPYRKELESEMEVSENDHPGNDENQLSYRKDVANALTIAERHFVAKTPVRKRGQREHTVTSELACAGLRTEIANHDNLLARRPKDAESGIVVPRKHHHELSPKQQQQRRTENADGPTDMPLLEERHHSVGLCRRRRVGSRKRIYSRKRQPRSPAAANLSSSDIAAAVYEDENCKKDSYLTCNNKKPTTAGAHRAGLKRKSEAISSGSVQESDVDPLSERVSPPELSPIEVGQQRRSSIDFQPVVRMMKLDDQVDIDHHNSSILSVTVASNRRLRSSGTSRSSTAKPTRKRLKTAGGRAQFGRWLKNS